MTENQKNAYEWTKSHDYSSVTFRYAKELAGLVDDLLAEPSGKWISTKERKPADEDGCVLVVVSGKPCKNTTLDGAYAFATYCKGEGWVIEEYPEWETPEVACWMPLPEPPEEGWI